MRIQEQLTVIVPWGWDRLFICFYSSHSRHEYHFPLDMVWLRILIVIQMLYILAEIWGCKSRSRACRRQQFKQRSEQKVCCWERCWPSRALSRVPSQVSHYWHQWGNFLADFSVCVCGVTRSAATPFSPRLFFIRWQPRGPRAGGRASAYWEAWGKPAPGWTSYSRISQICGGSLSKFCHNIIVTVEALKAVLHPSGSEAKHCRLLSLVWGTSTLLEHHQIHKPFLLRSSEELQK